MLERGALILQHGATGPPGVLGTWLAERDIPARVVDLREGEDPPDPAEFDFVASLGSEFSVNDGEPWIAVERRTLDRAVARDVPVLGLCFGGQSLAVSLGGEVAPMPTTEVGWLHLDSEDPDLIPSGPWLEYHRERFTVPPGAVELARRETSPQAFALGPHLGLQFHPEATAAIVDAWVELDPEFDAYGIERAAVGTPGEQTEAAAATNARRLFDRWLRRWAGA
ncbi:MAG: type 1 glutamine amidotransferase [Solirubrobacteraceae bacterium]